MNNLPVVKPLSLALGAEVLNLDLSESLDIALQAFVKQAFHQYSVLVFRDQVLTVENQKNFARFFGKLFIQDHLLPVTLEGHPECMILHNNDKTPPGLNYWHTDNSGWKEPPLATMLYAKITPEIGGDTLFSNMYKAYETLSTTMQNFLKPLKAIHDVQKAFGSEYGNLRLSLQEKYHIDPDSHFIRYKPVLHPIVRLHPETKKPALYISEPYITRIDGLKKEESKVILDFLYQHIRTQEFIYRHCWRKNDLLIWDNRCTQHYATADYFPFERLMYRLNICGEIPLCAEL